MKIWLDAQLSPALAPWMSAQQVARTAGFAVRIFSVAIMSTVL
jgi:predicted nuclease of predicted toxin-antitoxin system